jgi:thiol:disulfide interchange protein DsbC
MTNIHGLFCYNRDAFRRGPVEPATRITVQSRYTMWHAAEPALQKESLMNNVFLRTSIALSATLLFFVAPATAEEVSAELQHVREIVSEKFSGVEAGHVFESPVAGWYEVRRGAVVAYVSADGRFLMQGDMIDLDQQVNLSENSRNEARVDMMSSVPNDDLIVFTPDEVKYTVSVFTDVDCTYCRRLHSQMDQYLAQGIEVRYFLYPRSGPASASWSTAEKVWCADDRQKAITQAKLDKSFDSASCDASMINSHYSMGQDIGLRGTPAIVAQDGTLFSGYLPPAQLTEALASLEMESLDTAAAAQ